MSYVDHRRWSTPRARRARHRARPGIRAARSARLTATLATVCVVSGGLQVFGGGPVRAGTAAAPLTVAVAPYAGDAVSATPTASALGGTDVTYQVTVANTTASDQTNVAVPVSLPANFSLHTGSVIPSTGSTAVSAGTLTWSLPTLSGGASATLDYTETTNAPAAMESDSTSAGATSDQDSAAAASTAVEVVPAADLTVTVSHGTGGLSPGLGATETLTVANAGPSGVTGAVVTAQVAGGLVVSGSSSSVTGTTFADLGGGQFAWGGLDLPAGGTAVFTLTGNVPTSLGPGTIVAALAGLSLPMTEVNTGPAANAVDAAVVLQVPQAISFVAPATGIVGQSTTLAATGGASGNPVVFSVDSSSGAGVCSVAGPDGTALSYGAPGTCVVDADQAGDLTYASAPTVTRSIAVEQPPVFTQDSPPASATSGQPYGYTFAASGVPSPSFALSSSAPSWLTIDPVSGAVSGTPPAGTASFGYSVTASNGAGAVAAGPFAVSVAAPAGPPSPQADVSAGLWCPAVVRVQSVVTCTLVVANAGPATARSVLAAIALPRWSTRTDATGGARWFGRDTIWFAGSLASGSADRFSVSFRISVPGAVTVAGAALATSPDPNYANNVAFVHLLVTGQ